VDKTCVMHEDTFYEYFKPIRHARTMRDIWGGHGLETYGEDIEIVRRHDPDFVWTIVDGESGSQWITAGFHYVNRICYLISEKPHNSIPAGFRIRNDGHSLTPLGLKRQMLKLERLLAEAAPH
jgi:hypothetical protein